MTMGKFLGIHFAPIRIPLERRLQTLGALFWMLCLSLSSFGGTTLVLYLLTTKFAILSLLYIAWIYYDKDTFRQGGRPSAWWRSLRIWKYCADYFPATLHKTTDLDPSKNYILGYHPHGVLALGAYIAFSTDALGFRTKYPGIRVYEAALNVNFYVPVLREFFLFSGAVGVDRESLEYITTKNGRGNAAVIVVGGAAESLDAVPNKMELTLKNRKGFAKLAIQTGASLVPCISFGENEIFSLRRYPKSSKIFKFQQLMKRILKFTLPFYRGRGVFQYTFGVLPFRRPLNIVVGQPIDTTQNTNPCQEEIDRLHDLYLTELKSLFDKHKVDFAADSNMEILFK